MSSVDPISLITPGFIFEPQNMVGTLTPPSHVVPFPFLNRSSSCQNEIYKLSQGPLSEVNTTIVFLSIFKFFNSFKIINPTP